MIERLEPVVKNYAWGDFEAIARLQGRAASTQPEAELWMGAHPLASSLVAATGQSLFEMIATNPIALLGPETAEAFGQLPFLAKILAAAQPLSIQAHPSLEQAVAGFAREEAAGIKRDAPNRTYRDANHKPELICALTPFEAKCGFRELEATKRLFEQLDDARLAPLVAKLNEVDRDQAVILHATLSWLLRLNADSVSELVAAVADSKSSSAEFARDLAWVGPMQELYGADVGILVGLLLNHVVLAPGEALFLGPGNVHAYLRGVGVELMANSDNVIRCGLTPKHIDVEELLAVVSCEPLDPPIQRPAGPIHQFDSPVPEFALTMVTDASGYEVRPDGPELLVVTDGEFSLVSGDLDGPIPLGMGDVYFVAGDRRPYQLTGAGQLWRSTVGHI